MALCHQTYPASSVEVIIADGRSTDQTRKIIKDFQTQHPNCLDVIVVDNPKRAIPSALNVAIETASGDIIIRLDAHSIPNPEYIERSVALLRQNIAENVGGVWDIKPGNDTVIAKAIALSAAHPLGIGNASYRSQNAKPSYVDTVPFGAYFRKTLTELGGYNEELLSNEDYELNTRIRKNGGKIWLDPNIRCTYFSRHSLSALSKQYWRYGYWKFQMLKRYPDTIRLRQAIPPLFVLSLVGLPIASLFLPLLIYLFLLEIFFYISILFLGTIKTAFTQQNRIILWVAMVLSMMTMHFSWGVSFLWALTTSIFRPGNRSK